MKGNSENKIRINLLSLVLGIFLVASLIFLGIFYFQNNRSNQENLLFKTILITNSKVIDASTLEQKGDGYYSEASFSYENKNYLGVQSNCRLSRGYYSDSSQEYKNIASDLRSSNIKDILIDIYTQELDTLSEIDLNIYEACEHFESAARYYDTYYNTGVTYDDPSYDMGTSEINIMNEKISLHDENVKKYNNLIADYKTELEKRLA